MNQIMQFLNNKECEVRVGFINKETLGLIDFKTNTITINLPLIIADVIIHEYYHYLYPHFSETKVVKKTSKKIKRLSRKQIERIALRVVEVANE